MLTKDMKLKLYPAVIAVLGLSLLLLLATRFEFTIWTEPAPPDESAPTEPDAVPPPQSDLSFESPIASPLTPEASTDNQPVVPSAAAPSASSAETSALGELRQGSLRVSNQTNHPVRVALLPHQPSSDSANAAAADKNQLELSYGEPAHWDFAPGEGSSRGLILSLPDSTLQVESGEVLVVFAQDGSRRYWGPYVVGETPLPIWNSSNQEWQLVVRP